MPAWFTPVFPVEVFEWNCAWRPVAAISNIIPPRAPRIEIARSMIRGGDLTVSAGLLQDKDSSGSEGAAAPSGISGLEGRDVAFRVEGRLAAVTGSRDRLAVDVVGDIAGGENARNI